MVKKYEAYPTRAKHVSGVWLISLLCGLYDSLMPVQRPDRWDRRRKVSSAKFGAKTVLFSDRLPLIVFNTDAKMEAKANAL